MSPTSEESPKPSSPSLTVNQIAKMKVVNNLTNPTVLPVGKIMSSWSGHILDNDDSKYMDWAYAMKLELTMVQLWEYVFNPPPHPHPEHEPRACHKLCADEEDPVTLWTYLKERHGGAASVKQVRLLQEALTTKCSSFEPLTKTVDTIFEKIDHAFDAGEVTKDLLKSIAVLSALSDKSFSHLYSIILRDLGQAGSMTRYGPAEIWQFLEGEQTLLEADKITSLTNDSNPTAFATKTFCSSHLTCTSCKAQKRPAHVYTGHTAPVMTHC
ncbi:hypothetical protein C0993_010469 [Termitomyces sp. T159_Od127]|nr:hypothetical protein C0993_010469 [Termitomyces sp. T159_Od127]